MMTSAKEEVQNILNALPDTASFEDIQYHIYVREKIERGLRDVEQRNTVSHEEMERRISKWTNR